MDVIMFLISDRLDQCSYGCGLAVVNLVKDILSDGGIK